MIAISQSPNLWTSAHEYPLWFGGTKDFARVRAMLRRADFDEAAICRILKIKNMASLSSVKPEEIDLGAAHSELLALLIRLFLFSEVVPCEEIGRLIDPAVLQSLFALDILRLDDSG